MLLGNCYFAKRKAFLAKKIYQELVMEFPDKELPHMHLGFTYHMMEEYEQAITEFEKIYPPSGYYPFFYNSYGDCLQEVGKLKQSREIFYKEIELYEKTGVIASAEMLDGTYENLLYLDIALRNNCYQQDLQSYYKFLDSIEMSEIMQEHLAGTIVYLCELLQNKWYRPLFLEFITYIENKGYLNLESYRKTVESAYASLESYQYHEDSKVNAFMENYLTASNGREYGLVDAPYEEMRREILTRAYMYEWYICQYYPGHEEEFSYIEKTYPYTWKVIQNFMQNVMQDTKSLQEKVLKNLYDFIQTKESVKELEKSLEKEYAKEISQKKEPVYLHESIEPYERTQKKIGRNEPCPCGSGKKYKQCCGR
ncbi:MAG: SEC-C domain-containing protein [Lachnospiraceae bacterium]|nr:SEC-C domain-containing protein [Lachnospiraceae bacterium]